jgi:RNA polymerase sigma-70 factor (ECF subfamily)
MAPADSGPTDFEDFFAATYPRVVAALTVSLGDREAAEDAAQDAFTKAYLRWSSVGSMDRPDGWVFIVAVRASRRALARRQRIDAAVARSGDAAAHAASAGSAPDESRGAELLSSGLLDRLTSRERMAVVLRFVVDLELADIARAMGCRVGTVKATLHSARGKVRRDLASAGVAHDDEGWLIHE